MKPVLKTFYDGLLEDRILATKCDKCGTTSLPPRSTCFNCGEKTEKWVQMSGRGTLLFASVGNYEAGAPYIQGTVKLEEGPLVAGRVVILGFDFSEPETIWEYNSANKKVVAEVFTNPNGARALQFRVV
jgi:uncharacterized OB-fold protein